MSSDNLEKSQTKMTPSNETFYKKLPVKQIQEIIQETINEILNLEFFVDSLINHLKQRK